nr:RluA family pseudouridine synthase [Hyphomonas sp. Mor2]
MTHVPKPYDPPPPEALTTLYVDDWIVVCDKPSGLLSVPGRGPEKVVCASSVLGARHEDVRIVHRLDMDTSGVMVFARSKDAQRHLSMQFERRSVSKQYEALIAGQPEARSGTVNAAIAKYSLNRPLRHLDPAGREAVTHWRVVEPVGPDTRVTLTPETGRSHQLRLHMASLGHPILGDVFYGDPHTHERLCLHAQSLAFRHPDTGAELRFESPAPF